MRKNCYILPQTFQTLIEREDILSVEEFLFHQHLTEQEWLLRKNGKAELKGISEFISQRRDVKIKQLEKLLINGTATATQIKGYEVLISQRDKENASNVLADNPDLKIKLVDCDGDL